MANVEFDGGEALEKALNELLKKSATAKVLDVGFFNTKRYPDKAGTYVAQVAFDNEYGRQPVKGATYISIRGRVMNDIGNPMRPFFRTALANGKPKYASQLGKIMVACKFDAKKSLTDFGHVIEKQIRDSITNWTTPPNSPATIADKGFNKPLVDSGDMLKAVESRVK